MNTVGAIMTKRQWHLCCLRFMTLGVSLITLGWTIMESVVSKPVAYYACAFIFGLIFMPILPMSFGFAKRVSG